MSTSVAPHELGVPATAAATRPATLALVGPLPPPAGGMANQTRQLARLLSDEGCAVTLVQVNAPYAPQWIGRVRGLRAVFRIVPYLFRLWQAVGRVEIVHVMANSGWAWHLFAAPAVWICALRRRPVVVNYRGGEAETFFARSFRWVRPTLDRAAAVVVPSGFLEAVFGRHGVATVVVPNIVNLEDFRPARIRPVDPHLVIARNLEPIYDIGTAIRALAIVARSVPAARLTVVGSGPCRDELESLVQELGVADRVRFTGRMDNSELPELYRSASVALNSSTVDNMPISLLEAMASGVPIVSTDVGGVPYLVRDGETALLVPPRDPERMAAAVLRLIADGGQVSRMVEAALAEIGQFGWTRVRPRLYQVYSRALREA